MNLRISRPFAISSLIALVFVAAAVQPDTKDFLWRHPWWRAFFVALPPLIVTVVGTIMLARQSRNSDDLQQRANELQAQLDDERNKHLHQIATNTKRELTQAEKNAVTLRKYIGARASVSDNIGYQPNTAEIAAIDEDNLVSLFTPYVRGGSQASFYNVRAGDLEITEMPHGGCAVRLNVIKRHGAVVQLGEITKWEDRLQPAAAPLFSKGGRAFDATYGKQGSDERRSIYIYTSSDGTNSFLLEPSNGENFVGNNIEVSKCFLVLQVEYLASGFTRSGFGTGGSKYPLFIL